MASPFTEIEVDDRVVKVTNPDRVYFPESGATKLDLVEYYLAVGPGIVNALRERPCMLHRYPTGIGGEKVHQKRVPGGAPPWLETVRVHFPRYGLHADELCVTEAHPGLVHLVSTVSGREREGVRWPEIFDAAFPPGSVSGAPKSSALTTIGDLEPTPRGPYCGAIGWVDGDTATAELAVGIRTFWAEDGQLHFGTGGGITWDSDPDDEWAETELKARNLLRVASGSG